MYSGEYDACDVTLSVDAHRASLKICLTTVGNEHTTFGKPANDLPRIVTHAREHYIHTHTSPLFKTR